MNRLSAAYRTLVRVEGIVQGVGFRPFAYCLATGLGLAGMVGNDADGVFAEVEGPSEAIDEFVTALREQAPPLARIERITTAAIAPTGSAGFSIAPSLPRHAGPQGHHGDPAATHRALVCADVATCADCLGELDDPADRRFGYPFINCTNCGPRYTITLGVPYDRALTTMASFPMCPRCTAEYHDPADRRFHAQATCCADCGPRLWLADDADAADSADSAGAATAVPAVPGAADVIDSGQVLAVKGLGGYHLAVDATSQSAAAALRERKHRADKPFAIMVADLDQALTLCEIDEPAQSLLTSARRPIVLLPRRRAATIAPAVAPRTRQLGVMLPYTATHHLLLRAVARPLVLTSANLSDEPIAYADADARLRLAGVADAFLTHDRAIATSAEDSVVRSRGGARGGACVIRRARGYAPEPLTLRPRRPARQVFARPVLACGAELKATFCLGKQNHAFMSPHLGDLDNADARQAYAEGIERLCLLLDVRPEVIAHDLHPDYASTAYAQGLAAEGLAGQGLAGHRPGELALIGVQHHHAHIASCLADNDAHGPVIGVAFDGTGYGTDATIWGGEFLIADLARWRRAGHLECVPMPGGQAAIRQPWRMAVAYLDAAFGAIADVPAAAGAVLRRNSRHAANVAAMARRGVSSPATSSAGRLFDAIAAIVGVRDVASYEGQAAIELEQVADPAERGAYPARIELTRGEPRREPTAEPPPLVARGTDLVRAVADDLVAGVDPAIISARFHNGVAALITRSCQAIRDRSGLGAVALSGGVFSNELLLSRVTGQLGAAGFTVLAHSRVPCNDGGISLGQAAVAAAVDYGDGLS